MERLQISVQEAQATCDMLTLSGEGQESDLDSMISVCIAAAKQLHFRDWNQLDSSGCSPLVVVFSSLVPGYFGVHLHTPWNATDG